MSFADKYTPYTPIQYDKYTPYIPTWRVAGSRCDTRAADPITIGPVNVYRDAFRVRVISGFAVHGFAQKPKTLVAIPTLHTQKENSRLIGYDRIWSDMMWCDVVWCGVIYSENVGDSSTVI